MLKSDTSPELVLQAAARRFKIDRRSYEISSGSDGAPRIVHANRHYNLGDFFTKHLQVPWEEARAVLTDCYHATLSDGLPAPDRALWRSFTEWRQRRFAERKDAAARARAASRARLVAAREAHRSARLNSQSLPPRERPGALAKARAERLAAQDEHRRLSILERAAARPPSRNAQYRQFLTELANQGHLAALAELRRAAPLDRAAFEGVAGSRGKTVLPLPAYKVDHHGRVTYYRNERSLVSDSARGVAVLQRDTEAYDTALRVAVARYGRTLTLRGDKAFVDNMVAAARRSGLALTIRDAAHPRSTPIEIAPRERGR